MRVILLSFVSLFLTQCTVADPTSSWLENAQGSWKLTSAGSEWLNDTVELGENATSIEDKIDILSSGDFTVGSTTFTFVGIDSTGVFAVYSFAVGNSDDSPTEYIALGFNDDYDILNVATVYTSSDSTITATTGNIFLTK